MDLAKKIAGVARDSGKIKETTQYFSVTEKREIPDGQGGMVEIDVPNGDHDVVILSESIVNGKGYDGKEQKQLELKITDNGKEKIWNVPIKNADGTLYYLIEDLEAIEIGEHFKVSAAKMKTGKYAKRITRSASPTVTPHTVDDENMQGAEEPIPPLEEGRSVSPDEIQF